MVITAHTRRLIQLAIEEDDVHRDVTSNLTIDPALSGSAAIIARSAMIFCGGTLIEPIIDVASMSLKVASVVPDGSEVQDGQEVALLSGPVRELLALERTFLNFVQKLSGIATYTRAMVGNVRTLKVLDTRKTTPAWRGLEKYAVRCGGGANHRDSLSAMALVKNNHIDANQGSITDTLERLYSKRPSNLAVEVEVRSLDELRAALPFAPESVMFDNMTDDQIREGLKLVASSPHRPIVEISGGVRAARLPILEALGVDCVSMGSLTTQAPWCDLSMRIRHE